MLLAQLSLIFGIDCNGWFGEIEQQMKLPQFIGIGYVGSLRCNFSA
ncbi:hypothetical protein [Peribacillus butanolivorans]